MATEKDEGADNSATETQTETTKELDLDGLREQVTKEAEGKEAEGKEAEASTEKKAEGKAEEEKDEWLQPPSSLKPEYKAEWAKLDKKWRQVLHSREQDFHKGLGEYKDSHTKWQALQKELAPYQARLNAVGGLEGFTREYAMLDYFLTSGNAQQKAQAINAFAQHYGLDLSQFGGKKPELSSDPTVRQLQQELAELRDAQTQSLTAEQRRTQAFEQERQQEAAKILSDFEADPKNIYFKDVKGKMAALIANGEAKDLQDAYDQACWANPAVRAAIAKQQREQEEKQRIEEAKRKAADARRASFDVQGQGAAASGAQALSLEQELAQRAGVQLSG